MSVYCMSDIHGHKEEFDQMLDLIDFSDDDELYVLGDIIDKGPHSADFLIWAIDEAPDNIHFVLGNHEDMACCVVKRDPANLGFYRDDLWHFNKGEITAVDLKKKTTVEWRYKKLLPWLENLESFYYIEVNGKPFMLTHAGFDPDFFDNRPEELKKEESVEENGDEMARHCWMEVGHGFGEQYSQDMLWMRQKWLYDTAPAPCDTIIGHTPLDAEDVLYIAKKIVPGSFGGGGKIAHIGNKHFIDCGCSHSAITYRPSNLGCLRLDDMKEFYIKAVEYSPEEDFKKLGKMYYADDPNYVPEFEEYVEDDSDAVDERWWV